MAHEHIRLQVGLPNVIRSKLVSNRTQDYWQDTLISLRLTQSFPYDKYHIAKVLDIVKISLSKHSIVTPSISSNKSLTLTTRLC